MIVSSIGKLGAVNSNSKIKNNVFNGDKTKHAEMQTMQQATTRSDNFSQQGNSKNSTFSVTI